MLTNLYTDGKHCPSRIQHLLPSNTGINSKLTKPNLYVHGKEKLKHDKPHNYTFIKSKQIIKTSDKLTEKLSNQDLNVNSPTILL